MFRRGFRILNATRFIPALFVAALVVAACSSGDTSTATPVPPVVTTTPTPVLPVVIPTPTLVPLAVTPTATPTTQATVPPSPTATPATAPTATSPSVPSPTPTPSFTSVPPSPTAPPTSTLSPTPSPVSADLPRIKLQNAYPNLPNDLFGDEPLFLTFPPDGSDRVAVVLQEGRIYIFDNDPGTTQAQLFLDIRGRVSTSGNEEGLLGLAFAPDHAESGVFYVYYSASGPRRSVVSRFRLAANPNQADPTSEEIILEVNQPFNNHNGGMIAFGPDGLLYIGLGDGGSAGDPNGNGQDLTTVLGTILRIVVSPDLDQPYGIPSDNPFVGASAPGGARSEIWAYGLRNPWRFSFDRATGDLWVGDVGQRQREEIDLVTKGGNYGWRRMEGFACFQPESNCRQPGLELPLVDYDHSLGCSVTGGYVYRGQAQPSLRGVYLYADFCSGNIWGLRYIDGEVAATDLLAETNVRISSFGEDEAGEIYITTFGGRVFRLEAAQ